MEKKGAVVANRVFLLSVLGTNVLTIALVVVLRGLGAVNDGTVLLLQFMTELFLVLPAAIYLFMQKKSLKESIGLRMISGKQLLLMIPVVFCVDKIAEFVNLFSQLFTENEIGTFMVNLVSAYPFLLVFFIVSIEPAICEEFVYRGVVYQGYRRGRILFAALLSAFLFGIMHMNLNQFAYAFVIGIFFALLNEAVGSIVPSMLAHLYINGKSVVLLYAVVGLGNGLREQYMEAELAGDTERMASIKEWAQGLPIESANWLEEYLSNSDVSVVSLLPGALVWAVVCLGALYFLLRALARSAGREGHLKDIFTFGKKETELGDKGKLSPLYFVTPCLVFGILYCLLYLCGLDERLTELLVKIFIK